MGIIAAPSRLFLSGHIRVMIFDVQEAPTYEWARKAKEQRAWRDMRESPNLIVSAGLTLITSALNWALVQNQNLGWGSPYVSTTGNLGDAYGAVGTGTSTPVATQTQLDTESARSIITQSSLGGAMLVLDAFLNTTQANVAITEVGWFMGATASANSGTLLDRVKLGTAINKNSGQTSIVELSLALTSG